MVKEEFIKQIKEEMVRATAAGKSFVDINSGEIHRKLGGYPGRNHSMPTCCAAMYELQMEKDEVLSAPLKGKGASLTIRYYL